MAAQLSLFEAPGAPSERSGAIRFWAARAADEDRAEPPAIPGPSHYHWQMFRKALGITFEPRDAKAFVNAYRELLELPKLGDR